MDAAWDHQLPSPPPFLQPFFGSTTSTHRNQLIRILPQLLLQLLHLLLLLTQPVLVLIHHHYNHLFLLILPSLLHHHHHPSFALTSWISLIVGATKERDYSTVIPLVLIIMLLFMVGSSLSNEISLFVHHPYHPHHPHHHIFPSRIERRRKTTKRRMKGTFQRRRRTLIRFRLRAILILTTQRIIHQSQLYHLFLDFFHPAHRRQPFFLLLLSLLLSIHRLHQPSHPSPSLS